MNSHQEVDTMTTVRHMQQARRRSVHVEWVPVTDVDGRTHLEMRWHVSDDDSIATRRRRSA